MINRDFHMHTYFSSDSEASLDVMVERALSLGLDEICFTDHMDIDLPGAVPGNDFLFDPDDYFEKMQKLREQYADRIRINIGVELGLQTHIVREMEELTNKYPFDFVIGSSHVVHRKDPYYDEYFEGRSGHDAFLEYYESILENLHAYKGFDVYGHLDYALRYAPNKGYTLDYKEFGDVLDAILTEIVDSGLGIELNTAGLRFGMNHPNPHEDVIRRYRELGGDIITVGSDAHSPESIGYAFHKVKDILTECGFTHYNVFHGREAVYIPL
ncbi:MAG: histidinol-phosphatase HisJ family protein [Lachnospiraceae bacterium]|nr:histidinol-phosphatase HisJ family protein [Lachnospiraceae bacterium]